MDCSHVKSLLSGYVDGELGLGESESVRVHLADCQSCSSEEIALKALSTAVKKVQLQTAPHVLRARWQPAPEARSPRPTLMIGKAQAWLGIAAALVLIGFFSGRASQASASLSQELLASHVRSLIGNHLVDVISSDRHTVKPWFDGKVDFSVTPYDLASFGFPLKGGRLDYVDGRTTPVFVYGRRLHIINLYVFRGRVNFATSQEQGYQIVKWNRDDTTFAAISDVSRTDLEEFEKVFSAQR